MNTFKAVSLTSLHSSTFYNLQVSSHDNDDDDDDSILCSSAVETMNSTEVQQLWLTLHNTCSIKQC